MISMNVPLSLIKFHPKATLQTESSALDDIQPRILTNLYKQRQRCSGPNVLKSLPAFPSFFSPF